MTKQQYLKLKKIVDQALKELELEAIRKGMIFTDKYEEAVLDVKKRVLKKFGIEVEEYDNFQEETPKQEPTIISIKEIDEKLEQRLSEEISKIATREEISNMAEMIAKKIYEETPPIIKNEIVKEITIEKPILKTEIIKEIGT